MSQTSRITNLPRQIAISVAVMVGLALTGFVLTRSEKPNESAPPSTSSNVVKLSDTSKKLAGIETSIVKPVAAPKEIQTSGQVAFPADQTVKVAPKLAGRVGRVFVSVGDHVKLGQPLAILESVDAATAQTTNFQNENKLKIARINLERQEALFHLGTPDVTSARAALEQAKASAEAAKRVLDLTKQQERIGGFTQKPVEDAENAVVAANSALSQAQSDLRLAQLDYNRKVKLLDIGVTAKADVETSLDTLEKANASVQASTASVRLAKQALARETKAFSSGLYADQQVQQATSGYRQALLQQSAAEKALRLAEVQIMRDLQQARSDCQAAVFDAENSRRTLTLLGNPNGDGSVTITSPISGIVTERDVSPGQVVDQSQMTPWQMFVVSDNRTVWIQTDVYEKDIASVTLGTPVDVKVAAVPGRTFRGKVSQISPTLDSKSRAVKIRAEIPNPDEILRDGEYADVTVHITHGNVQPVIMIPLSAVQRDGDNEYVYVKNHETFERRPVKIGSLKGDNCEVLSGLWAGEQIVTRGAIFLGEQAQGD